jgi:hypothetical protein
MNAIPSINPRVLELLRFTESHNRHNEALIHATGEHFNIFQILGVGHLEVATHSPILAELLNPRGRHGQGAALLRLFLAELKIDGFDADNATVTTEYQAGPKTEKSGGRIDIVIKDGKGAIFIENKIYASDQDNQMERYRGFDRGAFLFYLTLDGRMPSNISEADLKRIQCECISYETHILAWLKECRKAVACLPNVRETITQYIHLIEELTHQSTTNRMNQELIDEIVKGEASLRAFFTLRDADAAVRAALILKLDAQLNEIANAIGLKREGALRELHKKDDHFYFTTPGLERCNLKMGCIFDAGNFVDFCFGFVKGNVNTPCAQAAELLAVFREQFPSKKQEPSDWWPAWDYWEAPYRYWGHRAFEAIRSGQFAQDLKVKLEKMTMIAKHVCPDTEIVPKG